jgi:hypothetical protein
VKIDISIAPVTPEVKQAIEDAWVAILRDELDARAQEQRDDEQTATPIAATPSAASR